MSHEKIDQQGLHIKGVGAVDIVRLHKERISRILADNFHLSSPISPHRYGRYDKTPPLYFPSNDGFCYATNLNGIGLFLVNEEDVFATAQVGSRVMGHTPSEWRKAGNVMINTLLPDLVNIADITAQLAARDIGIWQPDEVFDPKSPLSDFLYRLQVINGKINLVDNFRAVWTCGDLPRGRKNFYWWIASRIDEHTGTSYHLTKEQVAREHNQAVRVGELISEFVDVVDYDETRNARGLGDHRIDNKGVDLVLFPSEQLSKLLDTAVIYIQLKSSETGVEDFLKASIDYHKRKHLSFGLEWQKGKMVVLNVNEKVDSDILISDFLVQLANYYYVLDSPDQLESFLRHVAPEAMEIFYDRYEQIMHRRKPLLQWGHGRIK